ncbi:MAG: hypothetical protein GW938_09990 [Leptospira sp.]|nr:hypothetical protein [Leptospira sp.]NCS94651.1 hypothetical protein [Leptospira sp.]
MVIRHFIIGFFPFISIFILCNCFNNNTSESLGDELFYSLFYSTSNIACFGSQISDNWEFKDLENDERAGFLNRPQDSGYLDILSGSYENTSNNIKFSLQVREILDLLPANTYSNPNKPEFEWTYQLIGESQFHIGLTHFSNGVPQLIRFNELVPLVWKDGKNVGGCGSIQISGNQFSWICDKLSLPSLNDTTNSSFIKVEAFHRKNENETYDCY